METPQLVKSSRSSTDSLKRKLQSKIDLATNKYEVFEMSTEQLTELQGEIEVLAVAVGERMLQVNNRRPSYSSVVNDDLAQRRRNVITRYFNIDSDKVAKAELETLVERVMLARDFLWRRKRTLSTRRKRFNALSKCTRIVKAVAATQANFEEVDEDEKKSGDAKKKQKKKIKTPREQTKHDGDKSFSVSQEGL